MNKKKYDLRKVAKGAFLAALLIFILIDFVAWPQLNALRFGLWEGIIIEAAILAFIAFYGIRMVKREKNGQTTLGAEFIQTIAKYEFLMEQLISRDFKIKYKRSVLGIFWSFLNPLLMMIVQYVVFSLLLGVRDGAIPHYAIYLLCGIVMFNGFNDSCNQAMRAITSNASLITKVYVPKYIYPVTKVLSSSINLVLSMVPLILVTLVYGMFNGLYIHWSILLLPLALIFLITFTVGMGFLLSSLMVFFHDVEFLWGVISTMWMYATPIIYSTSLLEKHGAEWLARLMKLNPMYHYVTFLRTLIIDGASPAFSEYLVCGLFALGMLAIGGYVFHRTQDQFVLYI